MNTDTIWPCESSIISRLDPCRAVKLEKPRRHAHEDALCANIYMHAHKDTFCAYAYRHEHEDTLNA